LNTTTLSRGKNKRLVVDNKPMGLEIPDEGEIANGDLSYNELIEHIEDGVIHIPEFQREFVWTEEKILDLLDSMYKSYPRWEFDLLGHE